MIKLERKRTGILLFLAPFTVTGTFLFAMLELEIELELGIPALAFAILTGLVFIGTTILFLKSSKKPAAWVENEVLTIAGNFSSDTVIPLSDVENMSYVTGETLRRDEPRDALHVKLKGFSNWDIPITDKLEHISDRRLYKFIKANFYDLPYHEQNN